MSEPDTAQPPSEAQPAPRMQTVADAARDALPVVVGYVTLGLAAGILLVAELRDRKSVV